MKKVQLRCALIILIGVLASCVGCKNKSTDTIKRKVVGYNGYEINYELHGKVNSEKTLVFIHGWCGSIDVWKNQLKAFPNYKVLAIDLPGHGKSSKDVNADYSIDLFVNSISFILEEENITKAFIFGHSMGFAVSEVFALKYPEKVIGIGSIDGAHFEVENDEKSQMEWIAYNNYMAGTLHKEKGREDFINMLFLPTTPERLKNDVLSSSKETPLIIGKKIMESMSADMSFWEKRVVNIPCFVIHTPVYQLSEEYKHDFLKMYPKAEYNEIDDVSHFLMLEVPDTLNMLVSSYLKRVY